MIDTHPRMEGDETHRRSESTAIEPSTPAVAAFLSTVRYDDLSPETVERTKALCLDWLGAALAGATSEPIAILGRFVRAMGPSSGPATLVPTRETSSAFFAALANGASSHVVEMDDLHNGAVMHPGTVAFPAACAAAQDLDATGRDLIVAAVVGYEACLRVGAYLGRSHYRVFHTTGTAGTLGAAAEVLGSVGVPRTAQQAKFSLGTVLALIALRGRAGVADFDAAMLRSLDVRVLVERVTMEVDDAVDAAYPARWGAIVEVDTVGGQTFPSRIDEPKGDPNNPLTTQDVEDKFRLLASFNGGLTPGDAMAIIAVNAGEI